ncbi:transposase [Flavobacterium foetidum]|nr:transposase [Flavobacterium foetidum]
MELRAFFEKYPNEDACIEDFKNKRLKNGLICRKCGHNEHSFRRIDLKFQCRKCKNRISLRSGTVMENSNLPIRYWMICIELMTLTHRKISILRIQYLLGHKRYEPIWLMVQKIRLVMKQRDEKYRLRAYSEFDPEFLERIEKSVLQKKIS